MNRSCGARCRRPRRVPCGGAMKSKKVPFLCVHPHPRPLHPSPPPLSRAERGGSRFPSPLGRRGRDEGMASSAARGLCQAGGKFPGISCRPPARSLRMVCGKAQIYAVGCFARLRGRIPKKHWGPCSTLRRALLGSHPRKRGTCSSLRHRGLGTATGKRQASSRRPPARLRGHIPINGAPVPPYDALLRRCHHDLDAGVGGSEPRFDAGSHRLPVRVHPRLPRRVHLILLADIG